MLVAEYDYDTDIAVQREESLRIGIQQGLEQGLKQGFSVERTTQSLTRQNLCVYIITRLAKFVK